MRAWGIHVSARETIHLRTIPFDLRSQPDCRVLFPASRLGRAPGNAGFEEPATGDERAARRQFGSLTAVQEECRDERRIGLWETSCQDVRYALRGMRRAPGFALTVMLTIGLGLGINTAAFTVFNAYVLRPLAVKDPYAQYEAHWVTNSGRIRGSTWAQYQQLREDNPAFADVIVTRGMQSQVSGRQCFADFVSGNYFSMLGVRAAMGRTLTPADDAERAPVAVLSYAAWQNFFGSNPEIVGRKILVHGYPLIIVGVARAGFSGLGDVMRDFWMPASMYLQVAEGADPFTLTSSESLEVIARLRPGLSAARASILLNALAPRLAGDPGSGHKVDAIALRSNATAVQVSPQAFIILLPLTAAFALVLVMACANVANLMLARGFTRQREIGIRLSLGAARARLIRQLLTESVLLALRAAAAGFAISQLAIVGGMHAMLAVLPAEFADYIRVAPLESDFRVFLFMTAAAIACGLFFGLAPALQTTRGNIVQAARQDFGHQLRAQRTRNALVLVQVTVCSTLLIGAGILLRSASLLSHLDWGIRTRDTLSIECAEKFRARVLERLARESLVNTIASSSVLPLDSGFPYARIATADRGLLDSSYDYVSRGFFATLGIEIRGGRNFTREETLGGSPVAIVSQTLAQRLWPGSDGTGRTLEMITDSRSRLGEPIPLRREFRVIGVAADFTTALTEDAETRMLVYFPSTPQAAGSTLILRVNGDPEAARNESSAN
jgi:predicted permease